LSASRADLSRRRDKELAELRRLQKDSTALKQPEAGFDFSPETEPKKNRDILGTTNSSAIDDPAGVSPFFTLPTTEPLT
jgi:hypothetical protein